MIVGRPVVFYDDIGLTGGKKLFAKLVVWLQVSVKTDFRKEKYLPVSSMTISNHPLELSSSRENDIFDLPDIRHTAKWKGESPQGSSWAIYHGSALEVLRTMPKKTVNCVVTSPPYFWLRDYGVDGQIGMEDSISDYIDTLTAIMNEVRRVLRDDGVAFFNIGDTFYSGKGMSHGQDEKSKKRRFGLRAVDKSGGMGIGLQRKSLIGIPWRLATSTVSS